MSRAGLIRAEGQVVTSTPSTSKVVVQELSTVSGQFEPREISVGNLLTGGGTSFTEGSIIFADSTGSLAQDNTNLFWNDSTNTARIKNIDLGVSGTAGSLDIFPTTALKGKLAFTAADSAGDTTTAIVNASQSGARTYTIPDAGASASFAMTEGAQTLNGTKTIPTLITTTFTATNVDAGASGTAGTVDIFPTTASKGKIQLAAVSNTNDDTLTITNAAQAAARTYTIPDAGGAADFVMNAGTQTIAGVKTFSSVPLGTSVVASVYIPIISAQAGAVSVLFSAPFSGTITKIYASISGTIITTDIVITPSVYHAGSGAAITNGVVTVPLAGSDVGTTALATPTAANTFVAGDAITATITGGVNAVNGVITLLITRTA